MSWLNGKVSRVSWNTKFQCHSPHCYDHLKADTNLYLHVNRIIRSTGQFVDDVTARHFQGVHHFVPVISCTCFHQHLIALGAVPAANFSVLLLAVCLITYDPILDRTSGAVRGGATDRHTIFVPARSLFAELKAVSLPSVHLIQAGLLLALYEYANGQPERAFASIASRARMAYSAGIHRCRQQCVDDSAVGAAEAANTWWGIVICERNFAM
ncbi:hypothetical protein Hte_006404 [Hypoxylon texense]